MLKQDYKSVRKDIVSSIPLQLLPVHRQLLVRSSPRHSPQRSPRIYNKNIQNGNGGPMSVLKLKSSTSKFNHFTYKLYGITGCSLSTCSYDVMLLVGCTLVVTGQASNVAMLCLRADSFGIESNQISVLLPFYVGLGTVSRYALHVHSILYC